MDGTAARGPRRIPRPLDDWKSFDGWLAIGFFFVWGFLAAASALLRSWAVWIDDSLPPVNVLTVLAEVVAGWSPTILIVLACGIVVLLRRAGRYCSWVPACGIVLVFVLWPVGMALGRADHAA